MNCSLQLPLPVLTSPFFTCRANSGIEQKRREWLMYGAALYLFLPVPFTFDIESRAAMQMFQRAV